MTDLHDRIRAEMGLPKQDRCWYEWAGSRPMHTPPAYLHAVFLQAGEDPAHWLRPVLSLGIARKRQRRQHKSPGRWSVEAVGFYSNPGGLEICESSDLFVGYSGASATPPKDWWEAHDCDFAQVGELWT